MPHRAPHQIMMTPAAPEISSSLTRKSGRSLQQVRRRALDAQGGQGILHDPIEDEPALQHAFAIALAEAKAIVGTPHAPGACHAMWAAQQDVLRERFGIHWFTPTELNPDVEMD